VRKSKAASGYDVTQSAYACSLFSFTLPCVSGSAGQAIVPLYPLQQVEIREHLAGAYTTEASGSLRPGETAGPVSIDSLLSRFFNNAPPPSAMPRSTISAESRAAFVPARRDRVIIVETESPRGLANFFIGDGDRFRNPFDQIAAAHFERQLFVERNAEPNSILIASAVRSPISKLYFRLMYCVIASSISLPRRGTDFE